MLSLELTNSLEEISAQAMQSVPRSIREIEKVRKETTGLKTKLDEFNENLEKVSLSPFITYQLRLKRTQENH